MTLPWLSRSQSLIAAFLLVSVLMPAAAQAATLPAASLPTAQLVAQNAAFLEQAQCEEIYPHLTDTVTTSGGKPYHVVPSSESQRHFLCGPEAAANLTFQPGQVAGIFSNDAEAAIPLLIPLAIGGLAAYFAAPKAVESIANKAWQIVQGGAIWLLSGIFYLLSWAGGWLLGVSTWLLGYTVSISQFITHDFVTTGWPFVQGIVNLGFILVLLFIAFATTLRLDIGGGGVTKLLPKLLIGAILINFSLIIAGGILDLSRVVMAIEVKTLGGGGSIADVAAKVLQKTDAINSVYKITHGDFWLLTKNPTAANAQQVAASASSWEYIGEQFQAMIVIWGLAIAIFVIAITFYVRYVILLLLLILSPIPYLALVLPMSSGLGKQWWTNFLKWAFYGPVALFFLILITRLDNVTGNSGIFAHLTRTALVIIILFIAATSAKLVGGVGAGFAVGFAVGATKKLGRKTRDTASWTGRRAGREIASTASTVSRPITRPLKQNIGDFGRQVKKDVVAAARGGQYGAVGQFLAGPKRDEGGALKKGQKSPGSMLAGKVSKALGATDPAEQRDVAATTDLMRTRGGLTQNNIRVVNGPGAAAAISARTGTPSLAMLLPTNLAKKPVLATMQKIDNNSINVIAQESDNSSQVMAIAKNKDFWRDELGKPEGQTTMQDFQAAIASNTVIPDTDRRKILSEFTKVLDDIKAE